MTIGSGLPQVPASELQTLFQSSGSSSTGAGGSAATVDPLLDSSAGAGTGDPLLDPQASDGIDALFGTSGDPASAILADLAQQSADTSNEILATLAQKMDGGSSSDGGSATAASGASTADTGTSSTGASTASAPAPDALTIPSNTLDLAALGELAGTSGSASGSSASGGLVNLLA